MSERLLRDSKATYSAWSLDQLAKSEFFHEKLHEWQLMEVAREIEEVRGEELDWDLDELAISEQAWNKLVHRAIKPVIVFAHPAILSHIPRSVAYYRMLSMVSQKSMNRLGLSVARYEAGTALPDRTGALRIAQRLNEIISYLIQSDDELDAREFDLWRGMAAGTQAQGSWGNLKGQRIEIEVKVLLRQRLRDMELVEDEEVSRIELKDGRTVMFAAEPDVAIYVNGEIQVAIEIKGGIDTAGVLERVGAAVKSLRRAKEENSEAMTILFLQAVSVTETAQVDLETHQGTVNYWFTVEEFLDDPRRREAIFDLIGI